VFIVYDKLLKPRQSFLITLYLYCVEYLHRYKTQKCLMLRVCRPTGFMFFSKFWMLPLYTDATDFKTF